jgi:raffinose/stachyose/melibiose transport system permease protein
MSVADSFTRNRRAADTLPYLRWLVLAFGALAIIYPIAVFLINSLKTDQQFIVDPLGLPSYWAFSNYVTAWIKADMGRLILNSLFVSVCSTALAILLSSMLAFGLYAFRFRGRRAVLASIVMMITIPAQIYIIPLYIIVIQLHLINTYWALILPYAAGAMPLAVVLFSNYFAALPRELMDAARIDGATSLDIYWRVLLPLARPVIGAVTIFSFTGAWNEFFLALVFMQNKDVYTLPLGMQVFANSAYSIQFTLLFAAFTISMLPMVVVYLLMQRQFIAGLAGGALKG